VRLENKQIRVLFDPDTGGFVSLYDKVQGHDYVGAPHRALPFRLIAPEGERAGAHLDARGARAAIAGNRATFTYTLEDIQVLAAYQLDGAALMATLHLTNRSQKVIEEVMFPLVRGLAPLAEASIVWPHFRARRLEDPFATDNKRFKGKPFGGDHLTWNQHTQKEVGRYPAELCSAWCRYGNARHGIAIEGRHTDFSIMDFFFHKAVEKNHQPIRRTLDMMIVHPRRILPDQTYHASPVRICLHQGDWHRIAEDHRVWLETWIQKPDRPRKFSDSIGWHFFFMKHQDGTEVNTYADLPKMAQAALDAGCPYLMLFGWQAGGHDNHYWYRYLPNEAWGGEAALKSAIAQCRALGVELIPFFNGTLSNIETPEHKAFGYRWEAKTRTGHPYYAGDWARANYDVPMRNRALLHHEMCFCEGQRTLFLDTVRRLAQDYGFGNTQLDQIAEKMFCCYNPDHGHEAPDRAMVDGLAELLPKTRALVRKANPEGVLVSEALNDFTGQWCDSSWDWDLLFPFPDPILYTLPWLMASHEIDAFEYGEVNKAFAYKLHLDLKIDGGDAPITKYPEFARHVKRNAALRRRVAEYYTLADFRAHERIALSADTNIVANVFLNPTAKKIGIVVAEVGGAETRLNLTHAWRLRSGTLYIDSNLADPVPLEGRDKLYLALQPYEVKVLCMDLANDTDMPLKKGEP